MPYNDEEAEDVQFEALMDTLTGSGVKQKKLDLYNDVEAAVRTALRAGLDIAEVEATVVESVRHAVRRVLDRS